MTFASEQQIKELDKFYRMHRKLSTDTHEIYRLYLNLALRNNFSQFNYNYVL